MLAVALDGNDVQADYRDGAYHATLGWHVAAEPAVVVEVLTDFEHMASFVPNLQSSKIVARTGNVFRVAQQGKADFGPFSFPFESVRRIELLPDGRIVAQSISGSARQMQSEMRFQGEGGGTRLDYKVDVVPDRWLPSALGVSLMRHELAEQFSAISREIERRQKARQK